jgi:hypothetical protein
MAKLDPDLVVFVFGKQLELSLELPFSWKLLYFGTVSAAIASFVYMVRCPSIIRDYDCPSEMRKEGKGAQYIARSLLEVADTYRSRGVSSSRGRVAEELVGSRLPDLGFERRKIFLADFLTRYSSNYPKMLSEPEASKTAATRREATNPRLWVAHNQTEIQKDRLDEAFWYVRTLADRVHWAARFSTAAFYGIGFLFMVWVLGQNFLYVLGLTFPKLAADERGAETLVSLIGLLYPQVACW